MAKKTDSGSVVDEYIQSKEGGGSEAIQDVEFEEDVSFEPMTNIEESDFNIPVEERVDLKAQFEETQGGHAGSVEDVEAMDEPHAQPHDNFPPNENGVDESSSYGGGESTPHDSSVDEFDEMEEPSEMSGGGDRKPAPDRIKKKAMKKTAKRAARAYQNIMPMPFKWIGKFPNAKLMKLHMRDEIDMNVQFQMAENTQIVTLQEFVANTNAQADEVMSVDEEMREEFEEAFYDFLEEKEIAMTPTQRLITVIAEHSITLLTASLQINYQMKAVMNACKENYMTYKEGQGQPQPRPSQQQSSVHPSPQEEAKPPAPQPQVEQESEEHTEEVEVKEVD